MWNVFVVKNQLSEKNQKMCAKYAKKKDTNFSKPTVQKTVPSPLTPPRQNFSDNTDHQERNVSQSGQIMGLHLIFQNFLATHSQNTRLDA